MSGDTVQQVKDKLSIVDVVSGYVKLERSGTSLRARCPFHAEKTPSFFVSPERGTYHCFGCNVGGDIFSFVQAIEGVDFKGALKILAERAGVPLVYGKHEAKDDTDRLYTLLEAATIWYAAQMTDEARAYLEKRGITQGTIQAFRLGWAGNGWSDTVENFKKKGYSEKELLDSGLAKRSERGSVNDKFRNRIMFPIADSAGRIVGFSGRIFGEHASPEAPKYLNSPETALFRKSRILYGFDRAKQAIRKHGFAVLVEGQMDLLASHQAGWTNTVAVSGTAFTSEHAALVKRMAENIVLALDPDEAGIKAAGRAARAALAGGLNVKVVELLDGLDPADCILKKGADEWRRLIRGAKDIITFLLDVLQSRLKDRDRFRRAVESIVLPFLQDVTSPIARETYVREIAGRLGVSESAVAEALARVPRTDGGAPSAHVSPEAHAAPKEKNADRIEHALAILLWQEGVTAPAINIQQYATQLEEIIGAEAIVRVRTRGSHEQEALRFSAERLYGDRENLAREIEALMRVLRREHLARALEKATHELREAEVAGDEEHIRALTESCRLLTREIAELK